MAPPPASSMRTTRSAAPAGSATGANSGTIESTSTIAGNGGLILFNATIDNTGSNNAGVILSTGTNGHVNLQSAIVLGGTLRTANGGVILAIDRGSEFDNATLDTNSNVHTTNNNFLFLADTLTNRGTVFVDSGNNATELVANGSVTLTGTGVVQMSDNANNFIGGA